MIIHAVIPARGGSKGIPGKNIIDFCGHPLIAWTIDCALRCKSIEKVWVSTDDDEIGRTSMHYGADVIERPDNLGSDTATSESALLHAIEYINSTDTTQPTHLLFLQASSPLRETKEIDDAIGKFTNEHLDSLFSAACAEDFCLWKMDKQGLSSLNYDYQKRGRRQDNIDEQIWIETGSFYLSSISGLKESNNRLHGKIGICPVESWKAFEIDTYSSLDLCRSIFSSKLLPIIPPPKKS